MLYVLPKVKSMVCGAGDAGEGLKFVRDEGIPAEGYRIEATPSGIKVASSDEAGEYYALRTLSQIRAQSAKMPCFTIEDAPKYSYRGFMLDCCRHFFPLEEIKKLVRVMARLKLNKFHWHLTDDQGWRIEIKKYPKLTEIGSKRKSTRNDGKPVEGYYTQEEIKELVEFCRERHIEVIPEIDMPGHFTAAVASYPELSCTGKQIEVSERFGIMPDIACVGKDSTVEFCKNVLKEVSELFPSEYIHLGGDEALQLYWLDCPECGRRMSENGLKNEEELQGWFMTEMIKYANSLGKTPLIWNDGLVGGNVHGENMRVHYWLPVGKNKQAAQDASKNGVIYSSVKYFYLDYPHGMTPLKRTYAFEPKDIPTEYVEGIEAPLWTEYIEDIKTLEEHAFPRLFAVADRAWAEKTSYEEFNLRMDAFVKYITARYPLAIDKHPNPSIFRAEAQIIAFSRNIRDKTFIEGFKYVREFKRKRKIKYGK